MQILLHGAPFAQLLIHFGFEKTDHSAPVRFSAIEGGISVGHERLYVRAIVRIKRHASAKRNSQVMSVDSQFLRNSSKQAFAQDSDLPGTAIPMND
jgi:hypothetical protein